MTKDTSWMDKAACKGSSVNMYPGAGAAGKKQAGEAIKVCSTCTVRSKCLSHALENMHAPGINEVGKEVEGRFMGPGSFGVWGGTSEGTRRQMTKEMEASSSGNLNSSQFSEIIGEE